MKNLKRKIPSTEIQGHEGIFDDHLRSFDISTLRILENQVLVESKNFFCQRQGEVLGHNQPSSMDDVMDSSSTGSSSTKYSRIDPAPGSQLASWRLQQIRPFRPTSIFLKIQKSTVGISAQSLPFSSMLAVGKFSSNLQSIWGSSNQFTIRLSTIYTVRRYKYETERGREFGYR